MSRNNKIRVKRWVAERSGRVITLDCSSDKIMASVAPLAYFSNTDIREEHTQFLIEINHLIEQQTE